MPQIILGPSHRAVAQAIIPDEVLTVLQTRYFTSLAKIMDAEPCNHIDPLLIVTYSSQGKLDTLVMPVAAVFQGQHAEALKELGRNFVTGIGSPFAALLAYQTHYIEGEGEVQPGEDRAAAVERIMAAASPERHESLLVLAMTVDGRTQASFAPITRCGNNSILLAEPQPMADVQEDVLSYFFQGASEMMRMLVMMARAPGLKQ